MNSSLNRRSFLKVTGGTAALAAVNPFALHAAEAGHKRQLKKAIMWETIGLKGTVLEKCRTLKEAGFEGIEANSHMKQDEVVEAMEKTGLKAASVCGSLHWRKTLSDPDEKVRAEGLEALKQTLRDAKRYSAKTILLVPGKVVAQGKPNELVTYEECWKRSIEQIRKAIPLAEELGVKIAIENVWNNFLMKPEQAKQYLDEINSPWVGWHFDIGNHIRFQPSEEWIPVLGKRIVNLHIKEYSKAPGKGFKVQLLEGDNNWPAIMRELDKIDYTGWGISEMPGDQTSDLEKSKEFTARMDKIFAS